jgi:hypothetical protein
VGFVGFGPLHLYDRPSGITLKGTEAQFGETPIWPCHNSDDWLQRTASMASAQTIQALCHAAETKINL